MEKCPQQSLNEIFSEKYRTTIFIDADDTLWLDNKYFEKLRFELMRICCSTGKNEKKVAQIFKDMLMQHGLGEKEYANAIKKTAKYIEINSENMKSLNFAINNFLCHDIEILPGVEDALALMSKYNRVLLTKGCEREQKEKLSRSELGQYFDNVIIVRRKDPSYFKKLIKQCELKATEIIAIGNSIRHDIIPATEAGTAAIWVNHSNNTHGRNDYLPPKVCEIDGWEPIVSVLRRTS